RKIGYRERTNDSVHRKEGVHVELVRYRKQYKKIAMGYLSYISKSKLVKKLEETIELYETSDDWELYLLKCDEDFIGLIGIEIWPEEWKLHHITVNPSHRGEGLAKLMVQKVSERYPDLRPVATKHTSFLIP